MTAESATNQLQLWHENQTTTLMFHKTPKLFGVGSNDSGGAQSTPAHPVVTPLIEEQTCGIGTSRIKRYGQCTIDEEYFPK